MSYQPPFAITSEILNKVSLIAEKMGEFNVGVRHVSPQLRRLNKIKTITGTLQIEGSRLTEEQVSAVLEGKRVMGTVRELAELKGAIKAYENLSQLDPFNLNDLLKAHSWLMDDILNRAGHFRTKSVGIRKGKEVIHIAPPANRVSRLMADLFQWLKKSEYHPLITSSVFHYEFEFIHPFMDGNGRMGRLWQTLLLLRWRPLFQTLPLESVIKDHQQEYYRALAISDKSSDASTFITFILGVILETIEKNASTNALENVLVNIKSMKTPEAIIELVKFNRQLTRQEMAELIGKDIRTIGRAIKTLQDRKRLIRVGSDKTGCWKVL